MSVRYFFTILIFTFAFPASVFAIGAIAIDDEAGDKAAGYGLVTGYESEEEAFEAAMAMCADHGNENCRRVSWFETCGTYAASEEYYGAGWGATQDDADEMAFDKCGEDCEIIVSECE